MVLPIILKAKMKINIIEKATLPSWNFIINMTPQARNNYKHKLEDFFVYFIETVGYKDYAISECDVEVVVTKPTKRARDVDNVSYKSCFDGFVKAGLFCEDNDSVIKSLKTSIVYEKDIENIDISKNLFAICSINGLMNYIEKTQKQVPKNLNKIIYYEPTKYMTLDINARKNLEITERLKDKI